MLIEAIVYMALFSVLISGSVLASYDIHEHAGTILTSLYHANANRAASFQDHDANRQAFLQHIIRP